jgi:hypothetical protein
MKYFPQQPRLLWKRLLNKRVKQNEENKRITTTVNQPEIDAEPFGFVWAANSCAFDCVFLVLIYFTRLLKNEQLHSFQREFPYVNESMHALAHSKLSSDWCYHKPNLLSYIRDSPFYTDKCKQNKNTKVSTATIYLSFFSHPSVDNDNNTCFYSEYFHELSCRHKSENYRDGVRNNIVYLSSNVRSNLQDLVTKQLLQQPNRVKFCTVCLTKPVLTKVYSKTPLLLFILLNSPLTWLLGEKLDDQIVYGGCEYRLFGAVYFGCSHFRVRFRYEYNGVFNVWENDGMVHHTPDSFASKSTKCSESNEFPVSIGNENLFVVDTVMYVKREILFY